MCPRFVPVILPRTPNPLPCLSRSCQLLSYNGPTSLSIMKTPPPVITQPDQVLVKVKAASVNPLDVMMSRGYGREVLDSLRKTKGILVGSDNLSTFPLVLGRDFSGEVISVGCGVDTLSVGDSVWGATFPSYEGSHQDYCVVQLGSVTRKPPGLSHLDAASLPYAAMTAWSAITQAGCLTRPVGRHSSALVLGAGGGVGSIATQLLARFFQCEVIAVAAADAHPAITGYGATAVIDYKESDYYTQLNHLPQLDLVLDCAGLGEGTLQYARLLRPGGSLVSLSSPLLSSTDKTGVLPGTISSISSLARLNLSTLSSGNTFKWAFFSPSTSVLDVVSKLVEEDLLVSTVSNVYSMDNIVEAYKEVEHGSNRGKVVLKMDAVE